MYSSRMPLTIDKILYNLKIISFEDPFTFRLKKDPLAYEFDCMLSATCMSYIALVWIL